MKTEQKKKKRKRKLHEYLLIENGLIKNSIFTYINRFFLYASGVDNSMYLL